MGFQSKTKKLVVRSDDMAHTLDAAMHGRKLPANGSDGVGIKSNSQRSPRISFVYATQRATGSSFALIFFKRKKGGLSESCHCKLEGDAAMEIPALLTVLPIDLLFLLSGLAINAVQAVVFLSIRPLSMSLHRRINGFLAELLWLQPVWLLDWWAGVKAQLHADPETHQLMGKEFKLQYWNSM